MRVLLLAPHPFYQERGTPIATRLLIKTLSQRGDEIDVLTFGEGENVYYPNVTIRRTPGFIRGIRPGFSFRKVLSDFMMIGVATRMMARGSYNIVHAVEESAFIAILLKAIFRVPYVYDMDSSLAQQMVEKMPYLRPLSPLLRHMEGIAVKRSMAVIAVCQAIVDTARFYDGEKHICLLHDVADTEHRLPATAVDNLRDAVGVQGPILLYVGNLERYQGIDLVLESFALSRQAMKLHQAQIVIIGGIQKDIDKYRAKCKQLAIDDAVHFLGPRPLSHLPAYLRQADILLSPRTRGDNTPMKLYAYLQSGKPVVATDIYSHTQVLDSSIAQLAAPGAQSFADAIMPLVNDPTLRATLGAAGRKRVQHQYSYYVYKQKLHRFYGELELRLLATTYPTATRESGDRQP
jgi:glycosyltransferase involved in cell wall biosynthesis